MIWRCDLLPQYLKLKHEIDNAISEVLLSGKYTLGEKVFAFEKEFANYNGSENGISVANGTDGLILSLKALNIGQGDEVITTPFTAIPTVSAIIAVGAKPVFVDIDINTYLIDINKISNHITNKTKAIIPVHLFGNVVDIPRLKTLVSDQIPIIEDACQAHGSELNGCKAGSLGEFGVFSFYPTKNLGAYGDGGMILTKNIQYTEKLRLLRMYGMTDYNHISINGINSRLDELQAAILRIKLKYLDGQNKMRNEIANYYKTNLKSGIGYQFVERNVTSNYHQFVCRFPNIRDKVIEYLTNNQIQSNIYYKIPIPFQMANAFLGHKHGDFPNSEKLCEEVIALPIYAELEIDKLNFIIDTINKFI